MASNQVAAAAAGRPAAQVAALSQKETDGRRRTQAFGVLEAEELAKAIAWQAPKTSKLGHRVTALSDDSDDDDNFHRASDKGTSLSVSEAETQRQLQQLKFRPSKRLELDAKKFDDIHEDDQAVKYLLNQYEKECGEGYSLQMKAIKVLKSREKHVDTLDERNVEIDKSRGATFLEIA